MPVSVEYSRQASFFNRISAGMMKVGKNRLYLYAIG